MTYTGSGIPDDVPQSTREALTHVKLPQTQTFYFSYENGKAVRTEVQTGVSDTKNNWIDVISRRRAAPSEIDLRNASFGGPVDALDSHVSAMDGESATWMRFDGSEEVIVGDLSILTDGEPVHVGGADFENKQGVAEEQHGI
jgi:hypothetical protein